MTEERIAPAESDARPRPVGLMVAAGIFLLLLWAKGGAEIRMGDLWSGKSNLGPMISGFFPPDFSEWRTYLHEMTVTIQIALWGTFLSVLTAVPFGILSARNTAPAWLRMPMRRLMDACRAINEMVFALIFVAAVGLGPFAGVIALFIHTTGILAKLFSEAVEAADPRPVEGIRATGAGVLAEVRFGILPQVMPLFASVTLYRFESNVRSATVLGIIGAGGIGQTLYESIRGFAYPQAAAIMIVIAGSVMAIDALSGRLRHLWL